MNSVHNALGPANNSQSNNDDDETSLLEFEIKEHEDDEDDSEADDPGELDQHRPSTPALIEEQRSRGMLEPSAARAKPQPFGVHKRPGVKHSKHNAGSRTWGKAPDHSNGDPLKAQEDKEKRRIERIRRRKLALVSRPARYEDGSSQSSKASGLGVAHYRHNGIWDGLSITVAPDDNNKVEYQAITAALVAVLRVDLLRAGQSALILTDSESALRKIYESDLPRRWDEQQQVWLFRDVLDPVSEAPLETEVEFAHTFRRG
ncbi:hypothetical protein LTR78_008128 [Recurvomyces mirabilis]|uniref:RNase H type-1 domain-containing protein n=1 Tax=Recurvomyces mirabilis TaxID=574656 RepID=A0AAE0WFU2_9PEZI|nr:hypothetical protein LTR78_008128 [Recurvomyces mirabilis]